MSGKVDNIPVYSRNKSIIGDTSIFGYERKVNTFTPNNRETKQGVTIHYLGGL